MILSRTLHIFRKDVRGLRYEIAAALGVFTVSAYINATMSFEAFTHSPRMFNLLLVLVVWFLAARLIHAEVLPGDRQFWVTRPYSRVSLALAKLLFLVTFVAIPWAISDAVILRGQGIALQGIGSAFLWEQVARFSEIVLGAVAIAAVTATLFEFVLGMILVLASVLGVSFFQMRPPDYVQTRWVTDLLSFLILAGTAIGVTTWQYRRRGRWIGRVVILLMALIGVSSDPPSPLVWAAAGVPPRLNKYNLDSDAVRVGFGEPSEQRFAGRCVAASDAIVPLVVNGLPQGAWVSIRIPEFRIDGVSMLQKPYGAITPSGFAGNGRMQLNLPAPPVCSTPVEIRLRMEISVYHNPKTFDIPGDGSPIAIPQVGVCRRSRLPGGQELLPCLGVFHQPRVALLPGYPDSTPNFEAAPSPFPADIEISPVSWRQFVLNGGSRGTPAQVKLTTLEPMGGISKEFVLRGALP